VIDDIIRLFKNEVSGVNAKRYISGISNFHRIQVSPGLHEAIAYIESKLREFGYEPNIYRYPADGKTEYLGFRAPIGWKVRDAELKVVEPEEVLIGRFIDNPTLVIAHSGSAPQGMKAELVDVGKGMRDLDYSMDVTGKFVLACGSLRVVYEKAVVERGAAGIILYREDISNPHAYPYLGFWPTAEEVEKIPPMFSIPLEKALKLKELLRKDRVVVYARVETEFYTGDIEVLEVRIPGSRDKDVLLIAHICHPMPGANDNASGSGLLLELTRVARRLHDKGALKLGYGLRFWWVPEFSGVYAHLAENPNVLNEIISVINLDMVGGHQDKVGGVLTIIGVAEFSPCFLPLIAYYIFEKTVEGPRAYARPEVLPILRFKLTEYEGGSDHHVFADPLRGIPATAFIEWPDRYYHSDLDVVDNIDPILLKNVGAVALTLAYVISRINEEYFQECLQAVYSCALSFLFENARKLMGEQKWYALKKLDLLSRVYSDALKSLSIFEMGRKYASMLERVCERIIKVGEELKKELVEKRLLKEGEEPILDSEMVYRRTRMSIVRIYDIYRYLEKDDKDWWVRKVIEEKKGSVVDLFYYLVDGKRSLREIYDILKLIYKNLKEEDLIKIADILEKTEWLER